MHPNILLKYSLCNPNYFYTIYRNIKNLPKFTDESHNGYKSMRRLEVLASDGKNKPKKENQKTKNQED